MVGIVDTDAQEKKHLAILSDIDTLAATARQEAIEEVMGIVEKEIEKQEGMSTELSDLLTTLRGLSGKKE